MSTAASFLKVAAGLAVILAMREVASASGQNRTEKESSTFTITLRIYDYVHMNRPVLFAAESETTAILAQAGIGTRWVDCPTSQAESTRYPDCESPWGPDDFVLRLLPNAMVVSRAKGEEALGVAYESGDRPAYLASIFYDRVNGLAQGGSATMPALLGRTITHEIGHLVLGAHSHSSKGIMRPFWSDEELSLNGRIYLLFTPEQSRQMKTRLAARAQAWEAEEKAAKFGRQ